MQRRLKIKLAVTPAHAGALREYVTHRQTVQESGRSDVNSPPSLQEVQVCLFLLEIARAIDDAVRIGDCARIRALAEARRSI